MENAAMPNEEEAENLRRIAVTEYSDTLLQLRELESRVNSERENMQAAKKEFDETADELKLFGCTGLYIGNVQRALENGYFVVEITKATRLMVECGTKVDKEKLIRGARVVLSSKTRTIKHVLPPEIDPLVFKMLHEDPGIVEYQDLGGLDDQIKELKEAIELPLMNPDVFHRAGIKPPKCVLLYGPPGTGKTLIARAIAYNIEAHFLMVVSSAMGFKYLGEGARLIREMFRFARDHQPCVIFMDEIDGIAGRRFRAGTSLDRSVGVTLLELINQLDGFDELEKVKIIMATNRIDVIDPALLRPGRIDRKIEIPLPNEKARLDILKIHAAGIANHGKIDYEDVVKLSEGFSGADLSNVCTEAGLAAFCAGRDYVLHEDFMKAARKLVEAKKLEFSCHYPS